MKVHMMQQTSDSWWEIRRAIPTGSEFKRIITPAKGDLSKSYKTYLAELLAEAAMPDADYFSTRGVWRGNHAMERGKEFEPQARSWYTMHTDIVSQQVGFVMNDAGTFGCSPDGVSGLVFHDDGTATIEGVQEIKCPELDTQFYRLLEEEKTIPLDCKVQVHAHLVCCEAKWCDWISYHPDSKQEIIIRQEWDDYTHRVKEAVEEFVDKLTSEAKRLGVMLKNQERNAA